MSLNHLCKESIKLGRDTAQSTREYLELFGLKDTEDEKVIAMANALMMLTVRGKFNLKDFKVGEYCYSA